MKVKILFCLLILSGAAVGFWLWKNHKGKQADKVMIEEIKPDRGDIEVFIKTTGVVQPQNRLEMKPPINGRIEEILVREGDQVKRGQIVAWMSSTERAALLDAARPRGEETLKYWEEAYKATPLIAPIDGNVIVRSVEPGQTVTSADPVVVLSDRLIVKAQVDETDIGRVGLKQKALVSLDAYPQEKVKASVNHISYESQLVNNVTIYEVDILPERVPEVFRSGMTANVNIIEESRENVWRLPALAIRYDEAGAFVLIKGNTNSPPKVKKIEIGLSDDEYIEVTDGLDGEEMILVEKTSATLPKKNSKGDSPFTPFGRRSR